MLLREILHVKGRMVHTIGPRATLADVVQKLVELNCGSLVVCDGDAMVGIITERDLLRTMALQTKPLDDFAVEERMTRDALTAVPEDEVEEVMGLMTRHRIRHLPVLEDGKLAGIISIGDVVKAHHDRLCMENEYLMHYIQS